MTFLQFAEKILNEENKPLTPIEIWKIGEEKGYTKELRTKGLTPWDTISAQIYCNIRDEKEKSKFIKIGKEQIFFLNELVKNIDINTFEKEQEKSIPEHDSEYLEKDLHKYLTYFVYTNYKIFTKTISAQKSLKKERNSDKWRHPDLVGVYYPNWESDIVSISKDIGNFGIRLFSYELKRELNISNLRETFFQAVSNSSWANEGYLVASEINDDEEFYDEFKRLNNSFGIGLIKISVDDPSISKIIFQSKQKEDVDIETMNILSKKNKDFKELMVDIKADYTFSPRLRGKYDNIIPVEELYK
jgi:hypothetical protein